MKGLYAVLEDIVWLSQLGLSLMMPLLLCLGLCWWGCTRWGWPAWVYLPGILVGLASGGASFASFARLMMKRAARGAKPKGSAYNRH